MKKLIFTIGLFVVSISNNAFAQQDSTSTPLGRVEVIAVDGITSDELFKRAELWVASSFENPDKVITVIRKEDGEIILAPKCPYYYNKLMGSAGMSVPLDYVVKINTREGRCRVEITDFVHPVKSANFGLVTISEKAPDTGNGNYKMTRKWEQDVWDSLRATVIKHLDKMMQSIRMALTTESPASSEDW